MNANATVRPYSTQQLNRLHDQAHVQAATLRREAIDAFWHATWQWLAMPQRSAGPVHPKLHVAN
jgi:hypothetical protein